MSQPACALPPIARPIACCVQVAEKKYRRRIVRQGHDVCEIYRPPERKGGVLDTSPFAGKYATSEEADVERPDANARLCWRAVYRKSLHRNTELRKCLFFPMGEVHQGHKHTYVGAPNSRRHNKHRDVPHGAPHEQIEKRKKRDRTHPWKGEGRNILFPMKNKCSCSFTRSGSAGRGFLQAALISHDGRNRCPDQLLAGFCSCSLRLRGVGGGGMLCHQEAIDIDINVKGLREHDRAWLMAGGRETRRECVVC